MLFQGCGWDAEHGRRQLDRIRSGSWRRREAREQREGGRSESTEKVGGGGEGGGERLIRGL